MQDEVLTAAEVAGLLKVRPATVYAAAADGRLPSVCLWRGKRKSLIRFRRSDIERLLREKTALPDPPSPGCSKARR